MQSKPAYAKIQDGGERHLENQLYVITTVFMVHFAQIFTIAPHQLAVFENAIEDRINENTRWRRPPS
jgi:hypothetical protein